MFAANEQAVLLLRLMNSEAQTVMDAIELILARCSPVQLVEPGPDRDQLDTILRAAVRAPDHGRMQPWRFLSIQGDARRRLGDLMMQSLERREPTIEPTKLNSEREKSMRAPLIIAAAAAVRAHPKVPDIEQIVAVGAAVQNMILAAHALGFGAFWRTGPAAYDFEVKEALGFSASDALLGFIYLGSIGKAGKVSPVNLGGVARQW
jgi:nitroreductase